MESLPPAQLAGLFLVVVAAFVAVVTAIVALVRSGRTVPPFAGGTPREQQPHGDGGGRRVPTRG